MKLYIIVAMFFYVANAIVDIQMSNNKPRPAIPPSIGILAFAVQIFLFAWGAALLL